jgi:hypothetical protein
VLHGVWAFRYEVDVVQCAGPADVVEERNVEDNGPAHEDAVLVFHASHLSSRLHRVCRSYSSGRVVMPAMCWPSGTSQICFGSRAVERRASPPRTPLQPPDPVSTAGRPPVGKIGRRDRLGGLVHEYYRAAT